MIDVTQLKPTWLWVLGEEGPPPPVDRQLKRLFCLTAMTALSSCAHAVQEKDPEAEEAIAQYEYTVGWIKANAEDELTDWERKCLSLTPESWGERELMDASWKFQAAAIIGWALGLTKWLPAWLSHGPEDFDFVFIESSLDDVRSLVRPISKPEIELKNSVTCAWLWRCRDRDWSQPVGFFARRASQKHLAAFVVELDKSGQFDPPIRGDFNVEGRPFGSLSEAEANTIRSRSTERLRALNWLVGQQPDYDEISCDT